MRTPNHLEIKEQCREAIPAIFTKIGRQPPKNIYLDDQGWVNPCFFANDLVIRFNARDIHLPKFQREQLAYKKLNKIAPVPNCLVFDDSKDLAPFDFMVCQKMEGENLEKNWPSLNGKTQNSLAFQAGRLLADIHSVEMPYFGEISGRGPFPQAQTWTEYLRFVLNYHLNEAQELKIFKDEVSNRFLSFFEEAVPLFDKVLSSRWIHGDFHLGNLLYSKEKITGVLDFEWACAGDPLFDFAHLRDIEIKWPGSQTAFFEGYGANTDSEDSLKKLNVYTLIKNIELCVVAQKFFPKEEAEEFVRITEKHVQVKKLQAY